MIKKSLLPLFVLLSTFSFLQAQSCVGDNSLPDSIIVFPLPYQMEFPMRGIQDTACVGSYFETTFQINLPASVPVFGNDVPLQGASIPVEDGIQNLPDSLRYVCNPPTCEFTPEEVGCIVVYGVAEEGDVGEHDLKLTATLDIGFAYNTTLPEPNLAPGHYYLHVKPEGSANCTVVGVDEIQENAFDLRIQPNPLSDFAQIYVNVPTTSDYTFTVYNAVGAVMQTKSFNLYEGENYLEFDGAELPVGMYTFVLHNAKQATSGRLLIQR